jgi:predicted short-subunit dehydrogenase-like oxidoreductase (DUF2520 family)
MKTLTIIGCGKTGKAIGRLLSDSGTFRVSQVLTTSRASAEAAVEFIGSGEVVTRIDELTLADVILLGVPDDVIEKKAEELFASNLKLDTSVIFHCSGGLSSEILRKNPSWTVASMHPVKSFSDPCLACSQFKGTWVTLEGDQSAVALLSEAVRLIGGIPLEVPSDKKMIYHAGAVFVSNYVVTLFETGIRCLVDSGISPDTAKEILLPLLEGSVCTLREMETSEALTGPIARGDEDFVKKQHQLLRSFGDEYADMYAILGKAACKIAASGKDEMKAQALDKIKIYLSSARTINK